MSATKKKSKEKFICPKERKEIIDELRLKKYNNGISKNNRSFKKFTQK